jgi:two-component system, response regulator YesN
MKIKMLIVDDEGMQLQMIRQVISALRPGYEISTTNKPLTALNLMKQSRFDVLVTDIKMPQMDGIALISALREMAVPQPKVIILSGFNDFAYAQQAIRFGVFDYLLKPLDQDSIIVALNHVEEALALDRQRQGNGKEPPSLEWCLSKAVLQMELTCLEQYTIAGWQEKEPLVCIALLKEEVGTPEPSDVMEALFAVEKKAVTFPCGQKTLVSIVPLMSSQDPFAIAAALHKAMSEGLLKDGHFALSGAYSSTQLVQAYLAAQRMMGNALFLKVEGLVEQAPCTNVFAPFIETVLQGVWLQVEKELFAAKLLLSQGVVEAEALKASAVKATQELMSDRGKYPAVIAKDYIQATCRQLLSASGIEELNAGLQSLFNDLDKWAAEEGNAFRLRCALYIRQNYMKDISLTSIAKVFNYSDTYFSALFTRTFQTPLSRYLCRCRLEKAEELLVSGGQSIQEVAQVVGIPDPAYFNRVFKEQNGLSPKRYRQMHRK